MDEQEPQIGRSLTFLTAWFCPFAQRTWMALAEKQLTFRTVEVAIKNPQTGLWRQLDEKPAWFLKLNPLGKVPVLAYREEGGRVRSVYESLNCNEFLDDFAPHPEHPALFPLSPPDKAHARMIIDRFDRKFVPSFYAILLRQSSSDREAAAQELVKELHWLERAAHPEGPYFLGKQFSAVDCAILPWFIRLYILKHYRNFELPKDCQRLVSWYNKAMPRDAVQSTLRGPNPEDDYEDVLLHHYSKYADGTANSTSARDFG